MSCREEWWTLCWRRMPVKGKQQRVARRLGVFGDLPTRFMSRGLQVVPWFLEPVLLVPWTALFFLLARAQRRAVTSNLAALFPEWCRARVWWGAFRVFMNFAWTYADVKRCADGVGAVDWTVEGVDAFGHLAESEEGCIILTAHMGNYDMAAPLFSGRFGRTVYAVRAPEREPEMQVIREAELRKKEEQYPGFRSLYNRPGGMIGVDLARLLGAGNVVAVQADRVVFDVASMQVEVEDGLWLRLPKGPLALARATGAACYPLFITRDGWRRYRVTVHPQLALPPRKRGEDDTEAAKLWAETLLHEITKSWSQWFVFELLIGRGAPVEAKEGGA